MIGLTLTELKEAPLTVNSTIHTFHTVMKMDGSTEKPYMRSHPYSYTKAFITQTIIDQELFRLRGNESTAKVLHNKLHRAVVLDTYKSFLAEERGWKGTEGEFKIWWWEMRKQMGNGKWITGNRVFENWVSIVIWQTIDWHLTVSNYHPQKSG